MPADRRRLNFSWFRGESNSRGTASEAEKDSFTAGVSVGRIIQRQNEERVGGESQALAAMLFGRNFELLPGWWKQSTAYGIISAELARLGEDDAAVVPLNPGWAYAVSQEIDAQFFIIETQAFVSGPWAGSLAPGGEHLFDEVLALISLAQQNYVTPLLIDNAQTQSRTPRSLTLASAITRLRGAVAGSLRQVVEEQDPYALPISPLLVHLYEYEQRSVAAAELGSVR